MTKTVKIKVHKCLPPTYLIPSQSIGWFQLISKLPYSSSSRMYVKMAKMSIDFQTLCLNTCQAERSDEHKVSLLKIILELEVYPAI